MMSYNSIVGVSLRSDNQDFGIATGQEVDKFRKKRRNLKEELEQ